MSIGQDQSLIVDPFQVIVLLWVEIRLFGGVRSRQRLSSGPWLKRL